MRIIILISIFAFISCGKKIEKPYTNETWNYLTIRSSGHSFSVIAGEKRTSIIENNEKLIKSIKNSLSPFNALEKKILIPRNYHILNIQSGMNPAVIKIFKEKGQVYFNFDNYTYKVNNPSNYTTLLKTLLN